MQATEHISTHTGVETETETKTDGCTRGREGKCVFYEAQSELQRNEK